VFFVTYKHATLDTGGWLDLTRPGLTPGQKCQASLGALKILKFRKF